MNDHRIDPGHGQGVTGPRPGAGLSADDSATHRVPSGVAGPEPAERALLLADGNGPVSDGREGKAGLLTLQEVVNVTEQDQGRVARREQPGQDHVCSAGPEGERPLLGIGLRQEPPSDLDVGPPGQDSA